VTLVATGPEVHVQGPDGQRTSLLETFYREPGSTPHIETSIDHDELIVAVSVPPLPAGDRSVYSSCASAPRMNSRSSRSRPRLRSKGA
jgi:xanthine dehydrogenase YagS FAD-binding subunit